MIEVSLDQAGYLVTHRTDGNEVLGAVRFGDRFDAEDFAKLWGEWLGAPTRPLANDAAPGHFKRALL